MTEKLVLWSGKEVTARNAQNLINAGSFLFGWLIKNVPAHQRDQAFYDAVELWQELLVKIDPVERQLRDEERWEARDE